MAESGDRTIAEDLACPVEIQPGMDEATPTDWTWRLIGSSLPNAATFNLSHSDVSRVIVDVLRPSDSPFPFVDWTRIMARFPVRPGLPVPARAPALGPAPGPPSSGAAFGRRARLDPPTVVGEP